MKKQTVNRFSKGLNTDLHPLQTPPDTLTEAQNVEFVTIEGDQLILQKRVGNDPELDEGSATVKLSSGFKPVAVKELNNVAYILSHNEDTGEGEIGSFPSPDYDSFKWEPVGSPLVGTVVPLPPDFDDGLADEAVFTVTPDTLGSEQYATLSTKQYTFTVENLGETEDTYLLDFPTEHFVIQSLNPITIPSGNTDDFVLDLKTTDAVFEEDVKLYVNSYLDGSQQREITFENIWIYNVGPVPTLAEHRTVAADSSSNIDEESAIESTSYGIIEIKIIFDPNYGPYRVDLWIDRGLNGSFWWKFGVDSKYLEAGEVTWTDTGETPDDPDYPVYSATKKLSYAEVYKPIPFKIILPEIEALAYAWGTGTSTYIAPITLYFTRDGEVVPQGFINYEGDLDFNIYDPTGKAEYTWTSTGGLEETVWWWKVQ